MKTYDELLAENEALAAQVEKLKERNRKLDVDLLRALFYAPSSPVSPDTAYEIEAWYGKFKQVHLATKVRQGEQSGTWLKDSNVNGGKRQGGEK